MSEPLFQESGKFGGRPLPSQALSPRRDAPSHPRFGGCDFACSARHCWMYFRVSRRSRFGAQWNRPYESRTPIWDGFLLKKFSSKNKASPTIVSSSLSATSINAGSSWWRLPSAFSNITHVLRPNSACQAGLTRTTAYSHLTVPGP